MIDYNDIVNTSKEGLDILKMETAAHLATEGHLILKKFMYDFEKCVSEVCFFIEIVDGPLAQGKLQPTETSFENRVIRIRSDYAADGKYLSMTDNLGWAAHEFFHAFCYSQMYWTRNDRDMYNFFLSELKDKVYPETFQEYVPFAGQFKVMKERGNDKYIGEVINGYNNNPVFEKYIEISKMIK